MVKIILLLQACVLWCIAVVAQPARLIVQMHTHTSEREAIDVSNHLSTSGVPVVKFARLFQQVTPPDEALFRKFPFVPPFDLTKMYVCELADTTHIESAKQIIASWPGVKYVEIPLDAQPLTYPNDPQADSLVGLQKAVLRQIKAYAAWLNHQGDTATKVCILDTGTKWDHEDLVGNIAYNHNDPINGIDDDGNGLVDDFRGWDFGNNDNNPMPDVANTAGGHGTSVASLAGMQANNAKGGVGTGFYCRFLPIKIWNYNGSNFSNFRGYEAIVYAANQGCKVINCSWGSNRVQLQYERDIINYATFQKDALIVAAGGNSFSEANFVPATTDHVLGVAFCDTLDRISVASTFSYDLDITAPGVGVYGITPGGTTYGLTDAGSSMAAPLVAGAAALLRSKYPLLLGIQAAALLKANADVIDTLPFNQNRRYKTGDGRLNMKKALAAENQYYFDIVGSRVKAIGGGDQIQSGDTVLLYISLLNVLQPQTQVIVKLRSPQPFIQIIDSVVWMGNFAELQTKVNTSPFKFAVDAGTPNLSNFVLQLEWQSNECKQIRHLRMGVTNDWVALDTNHINLSVFANGRLGFNQLNYTNGRGTRYRGANLASDAGLMVGVSPQRVSNCVFSQNGRNDHFKPLEKARYVPYTGLDQHITAYYNDSLAGAATIGFQVKQSAYAQAIDSLNSVVFLQYELTNRSATTYDSAYVGLYHDWDIGNFNANKAAFDIATQCGYTFETSGNKRHAGVVQLTPHPTGFYAIDALPSAAGNNINLFDGFTIAEKWQTLSNPNLRQQAGTATNQGNNVVQVISARINEWAPSQKIRVAFALVMGDSLAEMLNKAKAAKNFYRRLHTGKLLVGDTIIKACEGDTLMLNLLVPMATRQKVYADSTLNTVLHDGGIFQTMVAHDTTFWLTNADSLFESRPWRVDVKYFARPSALFQMSPPQLDISQSQEALLLPADTTLVHYRYSVNNQWYSASSLPIVLQFDTVGVYQLCLQTTSSAACLSDTACISYQVFTITQAIHPLQNKSLRVYPNPAHDKVLVACADITKLEIVNLFGKMVSVEIKPHPLGYELDVSRLKPGIYLIKVHTKAGVETIKLQIG